MISLVLLSAGSSSRFGSPKALAAWGHCQVIQNLQDVLLASNLDEIIVVLGAFAEDIKPFLLKHKKIKIVYNKDYHLGQTSSFKVGLRAVSALTEAVGLLPVDFPLIQTETIDFLLEKFLSQRPALLLPCYRQQKGHPPFFNISLQNEIFALSDDQGLNTLFPKHQKDTRLCHVDDEGIILTFNTPDELAELQKKIIV